MQHSGLKKLITAALFLALAILLPFLTAQIPHIGKMLLPMHIPALLCGFICGPTYGLIIGFIAPILRMIMFGMPPLMVAVPMAFELAAYGFCTGYLYKNLKFSKFNVYFNLILSMIFGRLVWGLVEYVMSLIFHFEFGFSIFIAGALLNALLGIAIQLVFIPLIVIRLRKAKWLM